MRSRYRAAFLAVVLMAALCWPAQAYYHPQQGRWLSRDPIGERQLVENASQPPPSVSFAQGIDPDLEGEITSDTGTLPVPIEAMMVGSGSITATWQPDGNPYLFCLNNAVIGVDPNGEYVVLLVPLAVYAPRIIPMVQRVGPRIVVFFQYNGARFSTWLGAAAARGSEIHRVWGARLASGWQYNRLVPSVGRPDGINVVQKVVVELKPDNARAIQLGVQTLENRYIPGCNRVLQNCFEGQLQPYQIIEQPGQFVPWLLNTPTP